MPLFALVEQHRLEYLRALRGDLTRLACVPPMLPAQLDTGGDQERRRRDRRETNQRNGPDAEPPEWVAVDELYESASAGEAIKDEEALSPEAKEGA
jgi:hypothetical protein